MNNQPIIARDIEGESPIEIAAPEFAVTVLDLRRRGCDVAAVRAIAPHRLRLTPKPAASHPGRKKWLSLKGCRLR